MKLLKSSVVATALAFSLGSFSTPTFAVCLGMACMYNKMTPIEGIEATRGQIDEALKSIKDDNAGKDVVVMFIKEALKLSKEINANDKLDRNRNRANGYLKEARKAVEEGDSVKATENLQEADKRFTELKGMIDLTQADRVSQQTNLLNRIMDTHDTAAGARK
jgi:hypothetical protein